MFASSYVFGSTLDNPWASTYIEDPMTEVRKSNMTNAGVSIFILNAVYALYAIATVLDFQKYYPDHWNINSEETFVYYLCVLLMASCLLRHTYLFYRYLRDQSVSSSFLYVFWYYSYIVSVIVHYSKLMDRTYHVK